MSIDGFGAGPGQSLEQPLGIGGEALHGWLVATETFQRMMGEDSGTTGIDERYARRGFDGVGAWIMGRNMFGPIRGPWPDEEWKGWWGDDPPYHVPVFVLTHHRREPVEMKGGTIFHFVTGGIREAFDRAFEAAGGLDVRLGGGVSTVRQYLSWGLVDEMHLAVSPVLLGRGEALFAGLDLAGSGYEVAGSEASEAAVHVVIRKAGS